jgi:hypothetical protein
MTVKELIKELQVYCDPNAEVLVDNMYANEPAHEILMVEQVKTISVETELGPIQYNKVLLMYSRR